MVGRIPMIMWSYGPLPAGSYHTPCLVPLFRAGDPRTVNLGALKKGYGMSLEVQKKDCASEVSKAEAV